MNSSEGFVRMRTLQAVVLLIFVMILGRLAHIQLIDTRYVEMARGNVLRFEVQYPPRRGLRPQRRVPRAEPRVL